jgi:hypothetical protein
VLAAEAGTSWLQIALAGLRAIAALALFAAVARFALPALLERAARVRSRELFTMVAFLTVMGSAAIAEQIGLTLAVGAFMGGLLLSLSPYAHQLYAEVVLRGGLLGIFFTAVGMLFDPALPRSSGLRCSRTPQASLVLKAGLVAGIVVGALGMAAAPILTGLALRRPASSFVLAAVAGAAGLLDMTQQVFVAGSLATLWRRRSPSPPRRGSRRRSRPDRGSASRIPASIAREPRAGGRLRHGPDRARVLRSRDPVRGLDANAGSRRGRARRAGRVRRRRAALALAHSACAGRMVVAIADPTPRARSWPRARSLVPSSRASTSCSTSTRSRGPRRPWSSGS